MNESAPLMPLWLSYTERAELIRLIANALEQHVDRTSQVFTTMSLVQSELAVAASRDRGAKISFAQLRKVMNHDGTAVPVKLSSDERLCLVKNLELPIELEDKLLE